MYEKKSKSKLLNKLFDYKNSKKKLLNGFEYIKLY